MRSYPLPNSNHVSEAYDQFGRVDLTDSSYYGQPYDYYSIMVCMSLAYCNLPLPHSLRFSTTTVWPSARTVLRRWWPDDPRWHRSSAMRWTFPRSTCPRLTLCTAVHRAPAPAASPLRTGEFKYNNKPGRRCRRPLYRLERSSTCSSPPAPAVSALVYYLRANVTRWCGAFFALKCADRFL